MTERSEDAAAKLAKAAIMPVKINTAHLPEGVAGQPYSATVVAAGGRPPYSWTLLKPPPGITLSEAGLLAGTPESAGTFPLHLRVTDFAGCSAKATLRLVSQLPAAGRWFPLYPGTGMSNGSIGQIKGFFVGVASTNGQNLTVVSAGGYAFRPPRGTPLPDMVKGNVVSGGGKLWFVSVNANFQPLVASFDTAAESWVPLSAPAVFGERFALRSAWFDDSLWALGGESATGWGSAVSRSSDGVHWQNLPDAPWQGRYDPVSFGFGGKLWMGGGGNGAAISDLWSTSDGISWTQASDVPWLSSGGILRAATPLGGDRILASVAAPGGPSSQTSFWLMTSAGEWTPAPIPAAPTSFGQCRSLALCGDNIYSCDDGMNIQVYRQPESGY